jgi:hypothetical protein
MITVPQAVALGALLAVTVVLIALVVAGVAFVRAVAGPLVSASVSLAQAASRFQSVTAERRDGKVHLGGTFEQTIHSDVARESGASVTRLPRADGR